MKPIELIENALLNSSVKNNVVLDLFGGSGSTLIACEQLERKARLMELDEHYIDVIIQRWQKLTNKEAVRVDGVKFNDLQA
jgi:DNA modification methylase